jgi:hypothetical protein
MSAIEVIDEIQSLSREEQERVIAFVHELERSLAGKTSHTGKSSFEESTKWAVEEHAERCAVLPND